jgi:hypothetical protein
VSRSIKFEGKIKAFYVAMIGSVPVFIGLSLVAIPELGLEGAPVAMLVTFTIGCSYMLFRSQRGRTPVAMPYRSAGLAIALALACAAGYYAISPSAAALQALLAVAFFAAWLAMLLVSGAVPRYHRRPLADMAKAFIGRGPPRFDAELGLDAVKPRDRVALHAAILEGRSLDEIASPDDDAEKVARRLVRALRRAAAGGGGVGGEATRRDGEIGRYLFSTATVASRDASLKRLLSDGVGAQDLHELEGLIEVLRQAPEEVWEGEGRVGQRS